MSSVEPSLLDVPVPLAFIFSRLDDWQPLHGERHLTTIDGVLLQRLHYQLPEDLDSYLLYKYSQQYCNDGSLNVLHPSPIQLPILAKNDRTFTADALAVSKLIYRYVYDNNSSTLRQRLIADYVVQYGITNGALGDEILLQLCNISLADTCRSSVRPRINHDNNNNDKARQKVWPLLSHCLSAFKPTPTFYNYILKYVSDNAPDSYKSSLQQKLLQSALCCNSRVYPPCLLEWKTNQTLNPMAIPVVFADGYTLHGHVQSWTTNEEFVRRMLMVRNATGNVFGWTVCLHDNGSVYQADCDDLLLDNVSELDVFPAFPYQTNYVVVYSDSLYTSRQRFIPPDLQHYVDKSRVMDVDINEEYLDHDVGVDEKARPATTATAGTEGQPVLSLRSALNARYVSQTPAAGQWRSFVQTLPSDVTHTSTAGAASGTTGDIDRWLETVFNQALDGSVDDFNFDERTLSSRLKGGGDKQPQAQQRTILNAPVSQQPSEQQSLAVVTLPASIQSHSVVISGSGPSQTPAAAAAVTGPAVTSPTDSNVNAAIFKPAYVAPSVGSIPLGPIQLTSPEQLLQQQMLQQQQWQLHRENLNLQTQLENQQLENQLLKQRLQVQQQQQQQLLQLQVQQQQHSVGHSNGVTVTVGDTNAQNSSANDIVVTATNVKTKSSSEQSNSNSSPTSSAAVSTATPATLTAETVSASKTPKPPSQQQQQQSIVDSSEVFRTAATERQFVSRTGANSEIRVVRVGKIQWPPPPSADDLDADDGNHKAPSIQVGRLQIEEKPVTQPTSTDGGRKPVKANEPAVGSASTNSQVITQTKISRQSQERTVVQPVSTATSTTQHQQQLHKLESNSVPTATTSEAATSAPTATMMKEVDLQRAARVKQPQQADETATEEMSMKQRQKTLERLLNKTTNVEGCVSLPDNARLEKQTEFVAELPVHKPLPHQRTNNDIGARHEAPRSAVAEPVILDLRNISNAARTALHEDSSSKLPVLTYSPTVWKLSARKQLLSPLERLDDELSIDLIYSQVVIDVFSNSMFIPKEHIDDMKSLLSSNGVRSSQILTDQVAESFKIAIVETARKWPIYFSRVFVVSGGHRHRDINMLSVNDTGVRLLNRQQDCLNIMQHIPFEDLVDVSIPREKTLKLRLKPSSYIVYTNSEKSIYQLIRALLVETTQNAKRVRATANHTASNRSQLSFITGDIITLAAIPDGEDGVPPGWLYGAVHGRCGAFPADIVTAVNIRKLAPYRTMSGSLSVAAAAGTSNEDLVPSRQKVSTVKGSFIDANNKYTMLEFAVQYFRQPPNVRVADGDDITIRRSSHSQNSNSSAERLWRLHVDQIKWTDTAIQSPLLKSLESATIKQLAVSCFFYLLQYMGDGPVALEESELPNCAMKILTACWHQMEMRDEIFCQIIKQTTNNRSMKSTSCQQGWRMLSLMTSYFRCSDNLMPYLMTYIQQTAFDRRRAQYMLARICLHNVRQTVLYGGRKTLPSRTELMSVTRGGGPQQVTVTLPGGMPTSVSVNTSTVVQDAVDQICDKLEIPDVNERREFTLFLINKQDDDYYPIQPESYMFDVVSEKASSVDFYLLVQRTTWLYPLHLNSQNPTYIYIMYQQIRPDYIDGFLLTLPHKSLSKPARDELLFLAALQIRAADLQTLPPNDRIEMYLPRNAVQLRDLKVSHWTSQIGRQLSEMKQLSPFQCQIRFLEILSSWPLFGSTFFVVKKVNGFPRGLVSDGDCILSVNKSGLHLCSYRTHEVVVSILYNELLSVRHRVEKLGEEYVDIKRVQTFNDSTVVQLQSDEAESIAAVIGQYFMLMNLSKTSSYSSLQQPL